MDANVVKLATDDWQDLVAAISDFDQLSNVRDQFKVVTYPLGGEIPPDGLYVVLDGQVSLRLAGEEIARARLHDFFFEEYLAVSDLGSQLEAYALPGTRLLKLNHANWETLPLESRDAMRKFMFGDLVNVHMHDFQQPINCCNITATAFGLTALGYPTHVDDIFRDCNLPTAYVVNSGLTLGEMFDVSCTYIYKRGLKNQVSVECHYVDEELISERDLINAIKESDRIGGEKDILVANFNVGIAHNQPNQDGGHFALIAKCNHSTGIVHMVDVHPEKYGKLWVTNIQRLYQAMTQRDRSSFRARGLLRFSAGSEAMARLPSLHTTVKPVDLTSHANISGGTTRTFFQRGTTNLNSLGTLALAVRLLTATHAADDDLIEAANISPTEALSFVPSAEELAATMQRYCINSGRGISCRALSFESDAESGQDARNWFLHLLGELPKPGENTSRQLIVNIDVNKVLGCSAVQIPTSAQRETAYLDEFWCILSSFDPATGTVAVTDMTSSTTQMWQTSADNLFAGFGNHNNPALLSVTKSGKSASRDEANIRQTVEDHRLVLFYTDDDPWSYMLQSVLGNIGVTQLHAVNLTGSSRTMLRQKQQLIANSGRDEFPYLFLDGEDQGEVSDIVESVSRGDFQEVLQEKDINVILRVDTPSLDKNIFGYPKGGLTQAPDARKNILLCCCGSSAADKIPELIERLVAAGHDVKLVPSKPAEHFFKDFGMEHILRTIKPSDIYRDDDEWNFRYTEFGMPVRACHLALCDWADCVVVAPITCNTMGKIANGVADSLLTSVFVAWQYQRKPVILCPACNTNMWHNVTTQNNIHALKRLGAHIEGPRSGLLSNGTMGTGMMASVDEIADTVLTTLDEMEDQESRVMKWGAQAAASDDYREWLRVFRCIDEDVVGINICLEETGDTLLHYAAGGEGEMLEHGIERGVPDIKAARDLITRGIDVNARNDYDFSPLHVAIMNESVEMVELLLEAGADAASCLDFARSRRTHAEVLSLLDNWAIANSIDTDEPAVPQTIIHPDAEEDTALYFSYGSLKRGFPNHADHAEALQQFLGTAVTRQPMPLIVPHEPNCTNPNCPWLHRMPTLVRASGKGKPVMGEVFRVTESRLKELDLLEGYHGPAHPDNVYERKTITVKMDGNLLKVQAYFIVDAKGPMAAWQNGDAEAVADYTMDMAAVVPKPTQPTG